MRHGHKGHHGHHHCHKAGHNGGHGHGHGRWKEHMEKLAKENPEFAKKREEFIKHREEFKKQREELVKSNPEFVKEKEAFIKHREEFMKQKHEACGGHKHKGWKHKADTTKPEEKAADSSVIVKASEIAAFNPAIEHFDVEALGGPGIVAEGFGI